MFVTVKLASNLHKRCSRLVGTRRKERSWLPSLVNQFSNSLQTLGAQSSSAVPRILVTGCQGQIGSELVPLLRAKYGNNNVIASDIRRPSKEFVGQGPYKYLDVTDFKQVVNVCVSEDIDWVVHLSGILSAKGEREPNLAIAVNNRGTENILLACSQQGIRVYSPSSIAAFGPSTPLDNTPDLTIMRPSTIYGVGKVYGELLGEYYHKKMGLDYRSLRYPGVLSWKAEPGGGTTDYAIDIFYKAIQTNKYTCFLSPNARLPMMHMPDCLRATVELLTCPNASLSQRVYNVTAVSFTPAELAVEIAKHCKGFTIDYKPDYRDDIAKSWPKILDDSTARKDWGWKEQYGLEEIVKDMLTNLRRKLATN